MLMHRFFLPPESFQGGRVLFRGRFAHQLSRVLRLGPGDQVVALDGSGWEQVVSLAHFTPGAVEGRVVEQRPGLPEPHLEVVLYQALLKGEGFTRALRQGTEVGVRAFVAVVAERCIARPSEERLARWRTVVREAAEQCGRSRLPTVGGPIPLGEALAQGDGAGLLLWEGEEQHRLQRALAALRPALERGGRLRLYVGPEGGFTSEEAEAARSAGTAVVSLGRRILRAESAGPIAAALVLAAFDDLG